MSHNYVIGLSVLVAAFIFFYTPLLYAFFKIRKQQQATGFGGKTTPLD